MPRPIAPSDEARHGDAWTCLSPRVLDDALRSIRSAAWARLPYGSRAEGVASWLVMALECGDADLGEDRPAGLPAPTPSAAPLAGSGLAVAWEAGGRSLSADVAADGAVRWLRRTHGELIDVEAFAPGDVAAVDRGRDLMRWLLGRPGFASGRGE